MGTPNREPKEYNRNIMEYKDPGRYIPSIFLLYSWGSLFGVPNKVALLTGLKKSISTNGHSRKKEGPSASGFMLWFHGSAVAN